MASDMLNYYDHHLQPSRKKVILKACISGFGYFYKKIQWLHIGLGTGIYIYMNYLCTVTFTTCLKIQATALLEGEEV